MKVGKHSAPRVHEHPERERPAGPQGTLLVTLGELIEAVSSVANDPVEAAAVVTHLLRGRACPVPRR